jgi:mono/diheme cytochrome c family protein
MTRRVLVGRFSTEEDVLGAARAARENGFAIVDAYTPYPVHGLDRAMGLRSSRLPWACFVFGLIGVVFAITSQHWAMAHSWPLNVGGKPWNSIPAFIPTTFEVMVLIGGLGVVFAFLLRCRLLPGREAAPLFQGATDDTFVLVLDRPEDIGDEQTARQMFRQFHAVGVVEQQIGAGGAMSRGVVNFFLVLAFVASLGLHALAGRDRTRRNVEYMPDMAYSPAYDSFAPNPSFADGKTLQLPQPGTIARGRLPLHYGPSFEDFLRAGDALHNPFGLPGVAASTVGLAGSPVGQVPLLASSALVPGKTNAFAAADSRTVERGAFVFTNYCQMCHGPAGKGDGPMTQPLVQRGIPAPVSLLADNAVRMKDGEMFHVLTFGQRNMASQAAQLSREDRWKVIVYVRSLQDKARGENRP